MVRLEIRKRVWRVSGRRNRCAVAVNKPFASQILSVESCAVLCTYMRVAAGGWPVWFIEGGFLIWGRAFVSSRLCIPVAVGSVFANPAEVYHCGGAISLNPIKH